MDGANGGGGHGAVGGGILGAVVAHLLQHLAEVLEVEEQKLLVVSNAEHHAQHVALRVVEVENAAQQHGTHLADGGAQRVTLFTEHVPETDRALFILEPAGLQVVVGDALLEMHVAAARLGHAREVALDVGGEHRYAHGAEGFGQVLQGACLARACGSGNESVAVGHLRDDAEVFAVGNGVEGGTSVVYHRELCFNVVVFSMMRQSQEPLLLSFLSHLL